jgi:hypothetical protein
LLGNISTWKNRHTLIGLRKQFKDRGKLQILALNSSLSYVVKFAELIANNVSAKRVLDLNIGFAAKNGSIDEIELVDQQFKY